MDLEKEKIVKASEILNKIANGFNPVNGAPIDEDCFLQDPRIIRCLFFVEQVFNKVMDGSINKANGKSGQFAITAEEKGSVLFPPGNIGVNQIARSINNAIDLSRSRKITGAEINKQLKKMGILAEELLTDGKKRTIVTDNSVNYGIVTEKRSYNGNEYDMVCFNDTGKKYLLDELEKILEYDPGEV